MLTLYLCGKLIMTCFKLSYRLALWFDTLKLNAACASSTLLRHCVHFDYYCYRSIYTCIYSYLFHLGDLLDRAE